MLQVLRQSDTFVEGQLQARYGMDPELWRQSNRTSFPYNFSLLTIFGVSIAGIGLAMLHPVKSILDDYSLMVQVVVTTLISIVAYYLTDAFIVEFKEKMRDKDLYGKDLNKLGDHRDDAKEKM